MVSRKPKATGKKENKSIKDDKFFSEVTSRLKKNNPLGISKSSKLSKAPAKSAKKTQEIFFQQTSKDKKSKPTTKKSPVSATRSAAVTKTAPKTTARRSTRKAEAEEIPTLTSDSDSSTRSNRFKFNKKFSFLLLLIGLVAIVILLGNKFFVVAWVDKKPLTRWEYYQSLDKKYGNDTKEQMIVEKLITSEADKRGVSVTSTDIQNEIKKFETEQGGADRLDQILQLQGLSRDDLNRLVKLQLLKQKLFGTDVNVSDQEVTQYMDQNKDQLPDLTTADASTSAQIKSQVQDQLKQQKVNQNFQNWLNSNLQSNRVIRN
jgi:hypothetical protein